MVGALERRRGLKHQRDEFEYLCTRFGYLGEEHHHKT